MNVVFHTGPLSAFMLALPLLRALDRPVTVVAPWQRASLASKLIGAAPMDIELFEFTRLHSERGPSRVSPAVGELFASATRIVSFLSAEDDAWSANVRRLAPRATLIRIDPRPPAGDPSHVTDWHRARLAERGLALDPVEPTPIDNPDGPLVIHPGGSAIKRCWPAERYEQLINELTDKGLSVRPVIGEVELERWPTQRVDHWRGTLEAEVCRTADDLLPVLASARRFIGNDAGPMHLAAQLGVPTMGIYGPSDPRRVAPRGRHCMAVTPPGGPGRIEDVTIDAVLTALRVE